MAHAASLSRRSELSETRESLETDLAGCPGQEGEIRVARMKHRSPLSLSSASTSGGINYGFGVGAVIDQIRLAQGRGETQGGWGGAGGTGIHSKH